MRARYGLANRFSDIAVAVLELAGKRSINRVAGFKNLFFVAISSHCLFMIILSVGQVGKSVGCRTLGYASQARRWT